MPRALIAPAAEQVAFQEFESPPLSEGQVRVKSLYAAAKHGTEMSMFKGTPARAATLIPSFASSTIKAKAFNTPCRWATWASAKSSKLGPGVTQLKEGDRIFAYGPFREEHVWPETARGLPADVPWQAAVCPQPGGFCPRCRARRARPHRRRRSHLGPRCHQPDRRAILPLGRCPSHHRPRSIAQPARSSPRLRSRPRPRPHPMRCRRGDQEGHGQPRRGRDHRLQRASSGHAASPARSRLPRHNRGRRVSWSVTTGIDLGAEAHMNRPHIVFSRANSEPNPDHPNWDNARIYDVCWRMLGCRPSRLSAHRAADRVL